MLSLIVFTMLVCFEALCLVTVVDFALSVARDITMILTLPPGWLNLWHLSLHLDEWSMDVVLGLPDRYPYTTYPGSAVTTLTGELFRKSSTRGEKAIYPSLELVPSWLDFPFEYESQKCTCHFQGHLDESLSSRQYYYTIRTALLGITINIW